MLFLSGVLIPALRTAMRPDIGFMSTRACGSKPPSGMLVAYDNGCFAGTWNDKTWAAWVRVQPRGMFAVVPDVLRDARGTRQRFDQYASVIAGIHPIAYVAQDGIGAYPPPWDDFDVLFVGGSDEFKLSEEAWELCADAKQRGKWVHVGRVNSFRRARACHVSSVDSIDGTFLRLGQSRIYPTNPNWPKLCRWLDALNKQMVFTC